MQPKTSTRVPRRSPLRTATIGRPPSDRPSCHRTEGTLSVAAAGSRTPPRASTTSALVRARVTIATRALRGVSCVASVGPHRATRLTASSEATVVRPLRVRRGLAVSVCTYWNRERYCDRGPPARGLIRGVLAAALADLRADGDTSTACWSCVSSAGDARIGAFAHLAPERSAPAPARATACVVGFLRRRHGRAARVRRSWL